MSQAESVVLPPRLPLVVTTSNRNSTFTKDARLVNCYIETDESGELWIYKRPGLRIFSASAPSVGQGCYFWRGNFYHIANGTIYKNGVTYGPLLDIPGGTYYFSETLVATALKLTPLMVLTLVRICIALIVTSRPQRRKGLFT